MDKIKVVIIGAGLRGANTYGKYLEKYPDICEIIGVVEPKKERRDLFKQRYNIEDKYVFEKLEDFFKYEKIADAVIIANNDDGHYEPTKIALEKGYHILLEKPMANTLDKIIHLDELCDEYKDRVFMVSHVLRYTPFFNKLKEIVQSKELGDLISIQHNENIGYWHFAHSFTRGNWRNSSDTSPLILAKSCHDMDILLYLAGSKCKKVSAFGELSYFKGDNFKEEMGENCFSCKVEENCPYSAKKIYLNNKRDINYAVHMNPTEENLNEILQKGPYGRCVYKCDNNVVDNMVSILQFENNITATFNLSAFTKDCNRTIKLMFSHGEVGGSLMENTIRIKVFGKDEDTVINIDTDASGHGGGDATLLKDFLYAIKENSLDRVKSSAKNSVDSHIMAFAAEYARISDEVVYIDEFFENAIDTTNQIENTIF
ncbi:MAG: Gfo/Idh/MocA family oxidoreductase [Romboutsia sp.]